MANIPKRILVSNVKDFLGGPVVERLSKRISNCQIFAHDKSFDCIKTREDFLESLALDSATNIELIAGDTVKDIVSKVDTRIDILVNNDGYPAVK